MSRREISAAAARRDGADAVMVQVLQGKKGAPVMADTHRLQDHDLAELVGPLLFEVVPGIDGDLAGGNVCRVANGRGSVVVISVVM